MKTEERFSMRKLKMAFNSPGHLSFWKTVNGLHLRIQLGKRDWKFRRTQADCISFPCQSLPLSRPQGCREGAEASWKLHRWPMPNVAAKQETNIAKSWSQGLGPSGVVWFGSVQEKDLEPVGAKMKNKWGQAPSYWQWILMSASVSVYRALAKFKN